MSKGSGAAADQAIRKLGEIYSSLVDTHGTGPKSGGHRNERDRGIRFGRLAQIIEADEAPAGFSVNDLGCGNGSFLHFLDEKFPGVVSRYYGYDVDERILQKARGYLNDPRVDLMHSASITKEADYTIISGIFNVRLDASEAEWGAYMRETIRQSFERSRRGLAFYCLSTHVDWRDEKFFYVDPLEMFEFCRTRLSKYVALLHDYPLYEWTMLVRRAPAANP